MANKYTKHHVIWHFRFFLVTTFLFVCSTIYLPLRAESRIEAYGSDIFQAIANRAFDEAQRSGGLRNRFSYSTVHSSELFAMFCRETDDYKQFIFSFGDVPPRDLEVCKNTIPNGIVRVPISHNAIVLATSNNPNNYQLSTDQLIELIKENREKPNYWSEVDNSLPFNQINILGPEQNSSDDRYLTSFLWESCENKDSFDCQNVSIRRDNSYIRIGGNNNPLGWNSLSSSGFSIGLMPFSEYSVSQKSLNAISINGVTPTDDTVFKGGYPLTYSGWLYLKKESLGKEEVREFLKQLYSRDILEQDSILKELKLSPVSDSVRDEILGRLLNDDLGNTPYMLTVGGQTCSKSACAQGYKCCDGKCKKSC